jgi:hypothetical protein
MRQTLITLAALLALGCASSRPFQPTNNARQSLDKGPSFARYEVRTGAGDFGMVRVSLRTAGIANGRVPIDLDVVNDSSKAIALDAQRLSLQLIVSDKKQDFQILPATAPAGTEIAGHSKKNFRVEFPLASTVKPGQVSAFELSWGLVLGTENYTQSTGFSRDAQAEDTYYVYDPFFYPYASYGYLSGPRRSRSSLNLGIGFGIGN